MSENGKYIGRMKQPLQKPEIDCPTMFMLTDHRLAEMDLILLTPATFLHAYKFITFMDTRIVRLFIPSLRPEFISDIFNLYMTLREYKDIKWVFPQEYPHYSFTNGQIRAGAYQNLYQSNIVITYMKNTCVEGVYDIIVRTGNGTHLFPFYLTDKMLQEAFYKPECTFIHLPKSSTLYGGLSYDDAIKINPIYKRKLMPHDFRSIEELYDFQGRQVPEEELYKPIGMGVYKRDLI